MLKKSCYILACHIYYTGCVRISQGFIVIMWEVCTLSHRWSLPGFNAGARHKPRSIYCENDYGRVKNRRCKHKLFRLKGIYACLLTTPINLRIFFIRYFPKFYFLWCKICLNAEQQSKKIFHFLYLLIFIAPLKATWDFTVKEAVKTYFVCQ